MERELPVWQPYDPGEPGPELSLSRTADDASPRILVLLATGAAARDGWALRAGLSLVRHLASDNGRTLLADLDLENPRLHEALGVPNDEGVSDVFLWGASLRRVSHAVEPGLLFAPAGTVVADASSVAGSPRWDAVADGFGKARATLVLFVPDDAPGLQLLLDRSSDIVVLAAREEAHALDLAGREERVRAVLGPEPAPAGAAGAAPAGAAAAEAAPGGGPGTGAPEVDDLDPGWEEEISRAVAAAEARRFRPGLWIVMALVAVVALAVAAWAGWVDLPGLAGPGEDAAPATSEAAQDPAGTPVEEGADPADPDEAAGAGTPTADPVAGAGEDVAPGPGAPLQRFSLQLGAYPLADSAVTNARILGARLPEIPFIVAPVEVDGRVFHRLLAGVAEDAAGVPGLRGSLGGLGGDALVREAGWAFLLAEADALADARARAGELAAGAVQPYVLQVSTSAGTLYRVYAGAYAGESEAATLGALLAERGLADAALVRRVGRIPG